MAPSASTWRSWPRDGCPSRGQWKTACTHTSRIFHKVITAPPVWGNALQDNHVRRDPFLTLKLHTICALCPGCTQFVLLAWTIFVCLRRAKDKQNVPHINYHSGQTLQLMTWEIILNLPPPQNTLCCQPRGNTVSLQNPWKHIFQSRLGIRSARWTSQKVLPERYVLIQILLQFKLVQASNVDKMNAI